MQGSLQQSKYECKTFPYNNFYYVLLKFDTRNVPKRNSCTFLAERCC